MKATLTLAPLLALLALGGCGPKSTAGPQRVIEPPADPIDGPTEPAGGDAILAASKLPALLEAPLAIDSLAVEIHRLKNGMTVYISTDRTKPEISAWVAVRSGSRNDPATSTGLAHYLEHMLFKGSSVLATVDFAKEKVHLDQTARLYDQLRGESDPAERTRILAAIDAETQKAAAYAVPNEFDQLYAGLGIGGVNAFTSEDETVYIADVPANRFEAWAKVEGDRFADPQYRLFLPELEAVYEEKNQSTDSPQSRIFEQLGLLVFPKHPYGTQPTIGLTEHLKTPAYADMVAYFDRWYVPNNMAILLAGDIDAERALPVLEREFARLEPKALSFGPEARPAGDLTPPSGRREAEVIAPGENAVYLAWRAPNPVSVDAEALEVLDQLLDNSTTGLLNTELVLSQKLPAAGSFVFASKEASMIIVWGTARVGQSHAEVEALLTATLAKVQNGEFTDEDLAAIATNIEIAEKRASESNRARVSAMKDSFITGKSWPAMIGRLTRIKSVNKEAVVRLAKTLGGDVAVVRRVAGEFEPPKIEKPKITAVPIDTSKGSGFASEIRAMPATPLEPEFLVKDRDYRELALPAGLLLTAINGKNDLFALTYRWELGYRKDKLLCLAFDALENSGSSATDPVALRKKLYALGTSIAFSCDVDVTVVSVNGVDRNLAASVEILREWMGQAKIDGETVAKLVANKKSERADRIKEPRFVAAALDAYARDAKASRFLVEPSDRDLEQVASRKTGGSELAQKVGGLLALAHTTGYVGPQTPQSGAEMAAIGLGAKHKKVAPRAARVYRAASTPTIYFVDQKAAQAQVRVFWPKKPLGLTKRMVSFMYSTYIGDGLGALIGQEIREARGLAYSAWGGYAVGERLTDASGLFAGLGTQADKTTDALAAVIELLRGTGNVDGARFEVAKSTLVENYRQTRPDPRSTIRRVLAWKDLGLASDPDPDDYAAISAMTSEALSGFATGLASGGYIVAVAGDSARIDMKALAKLGKVITVAPKALVSW